MPDVKDVPWWPNFRLPFRDRCAHWVSTHLANARGTGHVSEVVNHGTGCPSGLCTDSLCLCLHPGSSVQSLFHGTSGTVPSLSNPVFFCVCCHWARLSFLWKICISSVKVSELSVCMSDTLNPILECWSFCSLIAVTTLLQFAVGFTF